LPTESTEVVPRVGASTPEPWQSWAMTVRYVIVQLAQAIPPVLLLWLAYILH